MVECPTCKKEIKETVLGGPDPVTWNIEGEVITKYYLAVRQECDCRKKVVPREVDPPRTTNT